MVVLTNFPPPVEGVRHAQQNTQAYVASKCLGNGSLFIAESRVSWVGVNDQGFSIEYPSISLHAVSRDISSFPEECLYLMVEGKLDSEEGGSESEDEDCDPMTDVRFVPGDKGTLDAMYLAMCDCQALHPDDDQDSISEGDDEYYNDEQGAENLTEEGQARLAHLENIFNAGDVGSHIPAEPQIGARPTNGHTEAGEANEAEEPMETGQFDDADS